KLAKQLHPDLNPGDKKAEQRFKQISAAHAILGDKDKRARYDRGEIDESGAEKQEQRFYRQYADTDAGHQYHSRAGYEDFADMGDIFSDLFRRSRAGGPGSGARYAMPGQDLRYNLQVGFIDAVNGATKRITLPDGGTLDVSIPRGVADGQTIRLKGKGGPGVNGGPQGDALIQLQVAPHPHFSREGDDILIDLPITIDEAVLGARVEVPTVSGSVNMSIPAGASSGQTLRLRGKGVEAKGRTAGDQLVRLRIVMPREVDQGLKDFMSGWKDAHAYDPRAALKVSS
ncbi:MAG: DnaJ C-terminal domain-containing protein, partial [Pseudomonadota bacterium]|nr:DnaJ C-terminal domain-containing protein [Pseudomonadota bacterium]